ncbi:MAG: phage portal protein [Jatrophihabitantaceae bacterium]
MSALESLAAGVRSTLNTILGTGATPIAPQALAETTPALFNGYFYAGTDLALVGKTMSYGALYRAQPSVHALIDKRANALARLSLNVWDTSPESGKVLDTTSPLARLIANPTNGSMSPFGFWRWMSSTYDVYGEVFALKQRSAAGAVIGLVPMTPTRLVAQRTIEGVVTYTFTIGVGSAGLLHVPADDVVSLLRYNPDNLMRGMSRLEPLRSTLANEDAARRANLSFWARGARPGTAISHPSTLSDAAVTRLGRQFDANYAGADKVGGTVVLDEGMKIEKIQLTLEEMQYLESRKLNMAEVCTVYDVPPPVVHILDHATFSNITEQMRSMYRDTMAPHLEDFESAFNTFLAAEFYPDGSHRVRFALDEVLRGDFETRATAVVSLVSSGVMKPSEARPLFDLVDAGAVADQLFANQAMQPLGTPVASTGFGGPPAAAAVAAAPEPLALPAGPGKAMTRKAVSMSGLIRSKATRKDMRDEAAKAQHKAIAAGLTRQATAIAGAWETYGNLDKDADPEGTAGDLYAPQDWDDDLAAELDDPTTATVDAFGRAAAGKSWDPDKVTAWVAASAAGAATGMNAATLSRLVDEVTKALATDDPTAEMGDRMTAFVDYMTGARVDQAAETRTTSLAAFGEHEGAKQAGAGAKTWVVNSAKPRASHAAVDGESVGMDEDFSNGMAYPGDPSADVDEIAGCDCTTEFTWES